MRRELYSTSEPKFFANMCNIDGTEDITGETFEDWLYRTHDMQESELSDDDYDSYFDEYRSCSVAASDDTAAYEDVMAADDDVEEDDVDGDYFPDEEEDIDEEESFTDYVEEVEVPIDVNITMAADGSWSYDTDNWAINPESESGLWEGESTGILLGNEGDVEEDINLLLLLMLPMTPGKFHLTGSASLKYNIEGIQTIEDVDGEISYDTDSAYVEFDQNDSKIDNFKIVPIK